MHHIFMFSFGRASFCAARRWTLAHGIDNVTLLFTDTKFEDKDTYRYGREAAPVIGAPLVEIAEGRNVWEVFRDVRMIGNTRADPCSRILKRELARAWMQYYYPDPSRAIVYVGIHHDERHRLPAIRAAWAPYRVEAPLTDDPILWPDDLKRMEADAGLREQDLYKEGFTHANCGGRCIKQGQGGFIRLLRNRPASFAEMEAKEEEIRQQLGKDVAILRDRRGGKTRPMTLKVLRERYQAGQPCDLFDDGGCGCFTDAD